MDLDQIMSGIFRDKHAFIELNNILRARVADVEIPARYGDENVAADSCACGKRLLPLLLRGFLRRFYWRT